MRACVRACVRAYERPCHICAFLLHATRTVRRILTLHSYYRGLVRFFSGLFTGCLMCQKRSGLPVKNGRLGYSHSRVSFFFFKGFSLVAYAQKIRGFPVNSYLTDFQINLFFCCLPWGQSLSALCLSCGFESADKIACFFFFFY